MSKPNYSGHEILLLSLKKPDLMIFNTHLTFIPTTPATYRMSFASLCKRIVVKSSFTITAYSTFSIIPLERLSKLDKCQLNFQ